MRNLENPDIAALNIASLVILLASIGVLWYKYRGRFQQDTSMILIIMSFGLLLLVTLTNVLEHLQITSYFDLFEDELKIIFIPLFIFAVLAYCLKRELQLNKYNERRIMDSHMHLNMSLEGAQESLWEWHPDIACLRISHENGYLGFNPSSFEIHEQNFRQVMHPDSYSTYSCLMEAVQSNLSVPENLQIQLLTTDNTYHWVLFRGKRVELEHSDVSYLGTIIDINVLKQVQQELIVSRQKAEESERLKLAFLNNISHEIRTPMNAIVGFSGFLSNDKLEKEKRDEYINIVANNCHNLLQIIEDIVEMSRIIVGGVQLYTHPVNLNTLLTQLQRTYFPQASSKGYPIICKAGEPARIIQTDEEKILRIFNNLISNAIKFTDRGFVEIGWKNDAHGIQFFVHDTGIGIPKEYQEVVFQNFQKIDDAARFYGGPGLGLSICKGLTEVLGGQIWMESQPEKGTTVYFTVPTAS